MASLRSILKKVTISFLVTFFIPIANASVPRKVSWELAQKGAWNAIQTCDWNHSILWSDILDQHSAELGTLYRLAWLQVGRQNYTNQENDPLKTWAWKSNPEIWKDELKLLVSGSSCKDGKKNTTVNYSQLDQEILESLFSPYIGKDFPQSPRLRNVLLEYSTFRWLSGKPLKFESKIKLDQLSKTEKCNWQALKLLEDKTDPNWHSFLNQCKNLPPVFDSIFHLKAGDIALQNGEFSVAFSHYQSSQKLFHENISVPALQYRIAISGLLAEAKDDHVIRVSSQLLSGSEIDPIYKTNLQTLVCDRLVLLQPNEIIKIFSKVFTSESLISGANTLTAQCSQVEFNSLRKSLVPYAKRDRDKSSLYGLLLKSASARGHFEEAKKYTASLASISHRLPYSASHDFWTSIQSDSPNHAALPSEKYFVLAKTYLKLASVSEMDQQKLDRLKSVSKRHRPRKTEDLQIDTSRGEKTVSLPLLLTVPDFSVKKEIPASFIQAFQEELESK